jgi:hypothetical protein
MQFADLEEYEGVVTVNETDFGLSKDRVFKGEVFYARGSVNLTLNQDFSFENVVSLEYDIIGEHQESGAEIVLGSYTGSIGPFLDLSSGTTLNYTFLDTPLLFPDTAPRGNYTLYLKPTKIEPEFVWNLVQENVEDLSLELGSTKYLGVRTPEIELTVKTPITVSAGKTFGVDLGVNAPEVQQVNLSLYYQKTGEDWTLLKSMSTAGTASWSETVTAPIYDGELKIIAQARSFVVVDTEVALLPPVVKSATVTVELEHPSLRIEVANPVGLDKEVQFNLVVNNPSPLSRQMELYVIPGWTIPAGTGLLERFLGTVETINVTTAGEHSFLLSAAPLREEGSYSLKVECLRYRVNGEWIRVSPSLKAEAIVTTTVNPAASLVLSPPSAYPGEEFALEVTVLNPSSDYAIRVPYQVKLYTQESRENVFLTTPVLWKAGEMVVPAGQTQQELLKYTDLTTERTYLGFELVVDRYFVGDTEFALEEPLVSRAIGYVKQVVPPAIKVIPSTSEVDMGEELPLRIHLKNPMGVDMSFTLKILQKIWRGAEAAQALFEERQVSLAAGAVQTLEVTAPPLAEPVIVEYGAVIKGNQVTLSGVGTFAVEASNWSRVKVKELVLPQISLVLNPNPVQVGSSLEVRTTVINPSTQNMTVPLFIYLKPPSSERFLWKQEESAIAPGSSISFTRYLAIDEQWQSLGTMEVIVETDNFVLGASSIPLARPIRVSQSFSILNLQLQAALKNEVDDFVLSYQEQDNYLVADKVWLESTITISNMGGWENSPDVRLRVEVVQSQGVEMVRGWQVVERETRELIGEELSLGARIAIANPTATTLRDIDFEVRVSVEASPVTTETFSLGISHIAGDSWYLDGQARLRHRITGERFASPVWDSDADGLSDHQEMVSLGTHPLNSDTDDDGFPDGEDPNPLTPDVQFSEEELQKLEAEKAQRKRELLSTIESFIISTGIFQQTVENGGTVLPTGQKGLERTMQQGRSAQESLEILKRMGAITDAEYADKSQELNTLLQRLEALQPVIAEKYGDSPTPRQVVEKVVEQIAQQTTEELSGDPDGDGLSTVTELQLGYDPYKWDSQQEGMSDGDYLSASLAYGGILDPEVKTTLAEEEPLSEEEKSFLNSYVGMDLLEEAITGMAEAAEEPGAPGVSPEELATTVRQDLQRALENATWGVFKGFLST